MRMLLPDARDGLTDTDLDDAYAWPGWPDPRPWLRANMVATVDGAARAPDGVSRGISSDVDRRVFGRLRGLADVVLAGAGTVRQEQYRPAQPKAEFVERRRAAGQAPVPAIAILTRSMAVDLSTPLFTEATARTILLTCAASDQRARRRAAEVADVIVVGDEDVDLAAAVAELRGRGLARIHCEGGPTVLADLAAHDLVDELLLTVTPLLSGGAYADHAPLNRILAGAELPSGPSPLALHHVLEGDGSLFLSYRRG